MNADTCTAEEIARHNAIYEKALRLADDEITSHLNTPKCEKPGWWRRRRLAKVVSLLHDALAIVPNNASTMYFLGLVHQILGDHERSFEWFAKSHRQAPHEPNLARDASLAAMAIGRAEDAVYFCRCAISADPSDAGLVSNLALALLISGQPNQAQEVAQQSVEQDPHDVVSQQVLQNIERVNRGMSQAPSVIPLENMSRAKGGHTNG